MYLGPAYVVFICAFRAFNALYMQASMIGDSEDEEARRALLRARSPIAPMLRLCFLSQAQAKYQRERRATVSAHSGQERPGAEVQVPFHEANLDL